MSANDTTAESSKAIGDLAESLAARFLEQHGLKVLTRNFRCRGGEIDLICRNGKTLVFVEVRRRRSASFGGAGASNGQRAGLSAAELARSETGQSDRSRGFSQESRL